MALADVDLHIKSGEVIGILGGTGSSKIYADPAHPASLRRHRGLRQGRRRGCPQLRSGGAAQQRSRRASEKRAFQRHHQGQSALGKSRRNATRRWWRPASLAQADEFIQQFPREVRHLDRTGRLQRFRRPETASVHRPRPAEEAEGADSGRLHQRRGYQDRRPDPPGLPRIHSRKRRKLSLHSVWHRFRTPTASSSWTAAASAPSAPMRNC